MDEASKLLTALTIGPSGFYKCDWMLFGLVNSLAIFQRLMETCLGGLQLNCYIIYLNDLVVFPKTSKEHLIQLRVVIEKLKEAGLKLKPSKCDFFEKYLTYLGYKILEKGIETDNCKIKVIQEWSVPKTVTEVRIFLGFMNDYCRLIYKYAQVA